MEGEQHPEVCSHLLGLVEDHGLVVEATQRRVAIHPQQGVEADGEVLVFKAASSSSGKPRFSRSTGQGQPNRDLLAAVSGEKPCRRGLAYPFPRLFIRIS